MCGKQFRWNRVLTNLIQENKNPSTKDAHQEFQTQNIENERSSVRNLYLYWQHIIKSHTAQDETRQDASYDETRLENQADAEVLNVKLKHK